MICYHQISNQPPMSHLDIKIICGLFRSIYKTFYGHRADWSQCVDMYFHSPVYQDFCHNAKQCEDIPIITAEQLYKMIQENEDYG